jgi:hypothetical protein
MFGEAGIQLELKQAGISYIGGPVLLSPLPGPTYLCYLLQSWARWELILFSFGRTVVAKLCLFSLVLHLQLGSCFRSFEYFHSSIGIGLHHQLCLCFRLSEHFHFAVGIGLHHQLCLCFRSSEYFHFSVG